jgi:phosphoribosylformylglycinamidine synthase
MAVTDPDAVLNSPERTTNQPVYKAADAYREMGLNDGEFARILSLVGRDLTLTELGMFSVMWSEHCGYKYSRPILAAFSRYKEALEGKGFENAGLVDVGGGLGVTFKVESHNHPSAVEPYQGAATGVGGIIRDILTMGARPIAALNSLRFGPLTPDQQTPPEVAARNRYLLEHVVAGIAGYGNCVGVPTVGGEVGFHPRYSGNPLVNAMCVGIVPLSDVTTAEAKGVGNPVIYLGSSTGKDGIHGATFASDALGEDSEAKRPNVQIGDPFAEKLLIEATLEALATGAVVAIQDMGAAGLTCSTIEMAAKGEIGMIVDLDTVPMRESDMTAYELMLSESQERMLAVAYKGREQEVLDVFHKWGLPAVVIGHLTADRKVVITRHGKVEAELDPLWLADECPTYSPPAEEPPHAIAARSFDLSQVEVADSTQALLDLLASPEIASKRWVYRQYDSQVQTQTTVLPGRGDAAVLAPRGTDQGLALTLDGNSRLVSLAPYIGGVSAVAEAARNVACAGAQPRAVTDGLNYGSPENPYVYWEFKESVQGIADAAEALETPVISGNVSFYNRSDLGEIPPTPLIGMLGVLEKAEHAIGIAPSLTNATLVLVEASDLEITHEGLGASAYLAHVHGIENGMPVMPHLKSERALHCFLVDGAASGLLLSAHDSSEGGLAVALAEIALAASSGLSAELEGSERLDAVLFGELPGRVVVGVSPDRDKEAVDAALALGLRAKVVGKLSAKTSIQLNVSGNSVVELSLDQLRNAYEGSLGQLLSPK